MGRQNSLYYKHATLTVYFLWGLRHSVVYYYCVYYDFLWFIRYFTKCKNFRGVSTPIKVSSLAWAMKIWDTYQKNVLKLHECNSIIMCSTNTAVHTIYNYMNNLLENYMICLAYCALVHVYVRFDPYSSYITVLALYLPFLLTLLFYQIEP